MNQVSISSSKKNPFLEATKTVILATVCPSLAPPAETDSSFSTAFSISIRVL